MNSKKILSSLYYTFNPYDKTIIFNSINIKQEDILLITNLTKSVIIYNFACQTEGGLLVNNKLTLITNTSLMLSSDKLIVILVDEDNKEHLLSNISIKLNNIEEILLPLIDLENNKSFINSISLINSEQKSEPWLYFHINSAQISIIKIGSGILGSIAINSPGNDTITIIDNYTGNGPIVAVLKPDVGKTPFIIEYNLNFVEGLTVITTGISDITLTYK